MIMLLLLFMHVSSPGLLLTIGCDTVRQAMNHTTDLTGWYTAWKVEKADISLWETPGSVKW